MTLQEFDSQISTIESKFQKKFDDLNLEFELKYQKQREEFSTKHKLQQSDFAKEIEKLKTTTIAAVLQPPPIEKTNLKSLLDKRIDPVAYAAFDKKPYTIQPGTKNSVYVLVPKFYPNFQDLDQIIEIDFHFGSRREELQLTGRLMHSQSKNKRHDIIMTESEFANYKKRILVLEEKGFHVKIMENGID